MTSLAFAATRLECLGSATPRLKPRRPRLWQTIVGALALVAALPSSDGYAQSLASLEPGARVRVAAEAVAPKPLVGTLVSLDGEAMELRLADRKDLARLPRETITKVEVSRGRRSRGRGALIGALLGFGVGAIAIAATPECKDPDCWEIFSKGEGIAVVGAMGAGLGALVGLAVPPGEKWESVPTAQISVVPGRGGHVRVSLSFAF